MDYQRNNIILECHQGVARGNVGGKVIDHKIVQANLRWPTIFKGSKDYARTYVVYQKVGKPYRRDELPLNPVRDLQPFEKWDIDFVGYIKPPTLQF